MYSHLLFQSDKIRIRDRREVRGNDRGVVSDIQKNRTGPDCKIHDMIQAGGIPGMNRERDGVGDMMPVEQVEGFFRHGIIPITPDPVMGLRVTVNTDLNSVRVCEQGESIFDENAI